MKPLLIALVLVVLAVVGCGEAPNCDRNHCCQNFWDTWEAEDPTECIGRGYPLRPRYPDQSEH